MSDLQVIQFRPDPAQYSVTSLVPVGESYGP